MKTNILLPLLALGLLAACNEKPLPPEPPKMVKTLIVSAGVSDRAQTYAGEVRARHETTLGFRIGGKIVARLVDAGASVVAGQPLARIDAADTVLQLNSAIAQYDLAEAETKRFRDLMAKSFISQSALDAKETALKSARTQADLARNQAAYTTLRAEHDGVISAVLAESGQVVAAGQGVFQQARQGELEIAINLPETAVASHKTGAAAEVQLWALPGKPITARIREISPTADPVTRTYPVRLQLIHASEDIRLGMTATVKFAQAGNSISKTISIPMAALFQDKAGPAVWRIGSDNRVTLQPVTISTYADEGAVIGTGLSAGERIVAAGVHKLVASELVRIVGDAKP